MRDCIIFYYFMCNIKIYVISQIRCLSSICCYRLTFLLDLYHSVRCPHHHTWEWSRKKRTTDYGRRIFVESLKYSAILCCFGYLYVGKIFNFSQVIVRGLFDVLTVHKARWCVHWTLFIDSDCVPISSKTVLWFSPSRVPSPLTLPSTLHLT